MLCAILARIIHFPAIKKGRLHFSEEREILSGIFDIMQRGTKGFDIKNS